jgi:hypothetical protein
MRWLVNRWNMAMRLSLFGGLRPFKVTEAVRDALAGVTLASMNERESGAEWLGAQRVAGFMKSTCGTAEAAALTGLGAEFPASRENAGSKLQF